MDIKIAFGLVLREFRKRKGFSQERLALECDLDRTFISLLERGQRQPTLSSLFKISSVLEVPAAEMIAETEKRLRS